MLKTIWYPLVEFGLAEALENSDEDAIHREAEEKAQASAKGREKPWVVVEEDLLLAFNDERFEVEEENRSLVCWNRQVYKAALPWNQVLSN